MISRRKFNALLSATLAASATPQSSCQSTAPQLIKGPKVISTWNNKKANRQALLHVSKGTDSLLDGIEQGIRVVESDPGDQSVGYGGRPDRDGHVTLDACIMDKAGNAGAVTFLEGFPHAISAARKVMEETPHVILSGEGAAQFAEEQGLERRDLLTEASRKEYEEWLEKEEYAPVINIERHDTIGMLALTAEGDLSGGCSTSGLAFKMRGRVGDSPIIGAGLYVDNEYGAAVATGLGELVLRQLSSFLVVEFMRAGHTPQKACEKAIERICERENVADAQVGLIALDKRGEIGAFSIHPGFTYAVSDKDSEWSEEAKSYFT